MKWLLCPDRLNIDPNVVDVEKEYWKFTFNNFIDECRENTPNKLH